MTELKGIIEIDDRGVWIDGKPVFGEEANRIKKELGWEPHTAIHAVPLDKQPSETP